MTTNELAFNPSGDELMVTIDPAIASRQHLFRLLTGIVVPRPIAWTSSTSPDGVPNLAPFNYYTVVSTVPPMLSLTLEARPDGRTKDTLSHIEATGEFVINSVSTELAEKMHYTSLEHAVEVDEFELCAVTPAPSSHVRPPRVAESKVSLECVLHSIVRPGGPFLDGYALTIIGVALITMKPALNLAGSPLGLAAAGALIGIFVGGAVFGWVTDKVGRPVIYMADLVVLILASLASGFVTDVWQLILLRFILAMAIGADYPIASSLLAEFVPSKHRGRLLGALFVTWGASAAAAAGCGWALSHLRDDSWRYMLASPVIFGLATLMLRLGTPESPRWLLSKGRDEEAEKVCRQVWGLDADIASIREDPTATRYSSIFRGIYLRRVIFVGIFYTAHVIPLFAVYTFGPDILAEKGIGASSTYGAELIISALLLAGSIPGLLLVDRMGRRPLLIWTFVMMSGAFTFMALASGAPALVLFLALAVYAIMSGACNFIEIIYPNKLFPTSVRATATGAVVAISRVGAATSTFLLPVLLINTGVSGVMWLMAAVNIAGLIVTLTLGEETKGRLLTETSGVLLASGPIEDPDARHDLDNIPVRAKN